MGLWGVPSRQFTLPLLVAFIRKASPSPPSSRYRGDVNFDDVRRPSTAAGNSELPAGRKGGPHAQQVGGYRARSHITVAVAKLIVQTDVKDTLRPCSHGDKVVRFIPAQVTSTALARSCRLPGALGPAAAWRPASSTVFRSSDHIHRACEHRAGDRAAMSWTSRFCALGSYDSTMYLSLKTRQRLVLFPPIICIRKYLVAPRA